MGIGSLGPMELVIIFVIILLIFGGKKLPELARGLGRGIKEFKKATKDVQDDLNLDDIDDDK
ncbi:twin-arginine translocase TatA/TatE family subunit [candidate division KSB1 bacterium]